MLDLTSNSVIDSIGKDDHSIEIVGYVDSIERPKIVGKVRKFKIMKFTLNNDAGRRIQCTAWQGQADRVAAEVQLNKIIYLDGVSAKGIDNQNFNSGNVGWEIVINSNAKINDLGDWQTTSEEEAPVVQLADVADTSGKITVNGYMKTLISLAENQQGASSKGIGSITDGTLKLEIHATAITNMPVGLEKGQPVSVTGTVCEGGIIYLQIVDGNSIIALDGSKMSIRDMINVTRVPIKRPRIDE